MVGGSQQARCRETRKLTRLMPSDSLAYRKPDKNGNKASIESSSWWLDREQPKLARPRHRLGPVACRQFPEDVIDMALHGANADHQRRSDGLVRRTACDKPQHIQLAVAERLHQWIWGMGVGRLRSRTEAVLGNGSQQAIDVGAQPAYALARQAAPMVGKLRPVFGKQGMHRRTLVEEDA